MDAFLQQFIQFFFIIGKRHLLVNGIIGIEPLGDKRIHLLFIRNGPSALGLNAGEYVVSIAGIDGIQLGCDDIFVRGIQIDFKVRLVREIFCGIKAICGKGSMAFQQRIEVSGKGRQITGRDVLGIFAGGLHVVQQCNKFF